MSKQRFYKLGFRGHVIRLDVGVNRLVLLSAVKLEWRFLFALHHHQRKFHFFDNFTQRTYRLNIIVVKSHQHYYFRRCYVDLLNRFKENHRFVRMMDSSEATDLYQITVNYKYSMKKMKKLISLNQIKKIELVIQGVNKVRNNVQKEEKDFRKHHRNGIIMSGIPFDNKLLK